MGEQKAIKLGDIAEIQTGPFGSQLHMRDYVTAGTPIVTVEHLGENKLLHDDLPMVSDEDRMRLTKYILKEGDIVFSRVGSVDRRAYVRRDEEGWLFSGRCLRVRPNSYVVDPKYLSYYFGQESFKEHIRAIAVGATMPSINTEILSNVLISVFDLPRQRAIAEVLSSLDDKIDLLRRQNNTLETLAGTLFRQWFVEEAGDKVRVELGRIAEVGTGKGLKREEFDENGQYPVLGANGEIGKTNDFLTDEQLILTGRVGTLGKVYINNDKVWISDNVLIVRPNDKQFFYPIYFTLKGIDFENLNVGSTQPLVTQTDLKKVDLILPSSEVLNAFSEHCSIYFEKQSRNKEQIHKLTQLRDTLLPKLMSNVATVSAD